MRKVHEKRHFIREWRKFRGLTLERLADRVGLQASSLSMLERGERSYTQPTLEAIADALETTPASLIMRNPADDGDVWSIEDRLAKASPEQRRQALAIVETLLKTGSD